jgi:hypothetical protein
MHHHGEPLSQFDCKGAAEVAGPRNEDPHLDIPLCSPILSA